MRSLSDWSGRVVLDLGCGSGFHLAGFASSAAQVYGVEPHPGLVRLAARRTRSLANVRVLAGTAQDVPLPDASVDVVISNCVINLSGDKPKVLRETARVLRPGGRFAVSDVIADPDMDDATRADMAQWTGCIAGALTRQEFEDALAAAGLVDVEITETHRVHEHAASAIIRARKPA
jgi:arsenite methyltransferase